MLKHWEHTDYSVKTTTRVEQTDAYKANNGLLLGIAILIAVVGLPVMVWIAQAIIH